jgi:uncharacterized SAM-binding protein YcdF (DUF218 family)
LGLVARILPVVLVLALLAAGLDFLGFVGRADRAVDNAAPAEGDAVAVLTGASDARIIAGVRLAEDLMLPLLISGVHVDTSPADIASIVGVEETEITCCVTLGRAAATTAGNGAEVAEWARRHEMRRIIVVTSEYHMDRALVELRRSMPEAEFTPFAVSSTRVRPRDFYRNPRTARQLFEEWLKYRVAILRPGPAASAPPQQAERA